MTDTTQNTVERVARHLQTALTGLEAARLAPGEAPPLLDIVQRAIMETAVAVAKGAGYSAETCTELGTSPVWRLS
jgi:hypothetical protein